MNETALWITIVGLAAGTYLIRFSFLGLIGDRELPAWVLRHLRYVPVSVLPGLAAPLVFWPQASDGAFDLPRFASALAVLVIGILSRSVIGAVAAGFALLYGLMFLV